MKTKLKHNKANCKIMNIELFLTKYIRVVEDKPCLLYTPIRMKYDKEF